MELYESQIKQFLLILDVLSIGSEYMDLLTRCSESSLRAISPAAVRMQLVPNFVGTALYTNSVDATTGRYVASDSQNRRSLCSSVEKSSLQGSMHVLPNGLMVSMPDSRICCSVSAIVMDALLH